MKQAFQGEVVVITGASSGIGEAVAREFAKQGASLALLARRLDRLKGLATELEAQGARAQAFHCDVTSDTEVPQAIEQVRKHFGQIDVVVANAGFGVVGKFSELKIEDYRRQFETNIFGVMRTAWAALPDLKKSRGSLVVTGSISGHLSAPDASPYSMSKYAVRALTETLYSELAVARVSVTLISPGFVQSEIRHVNNQGTFNAEARDPIPSWLRMPAPVAARQIVRAVARRKREYIVTGHGKFLVWFQRFFPGVLAGIMRMGARRDLQRRGFTPQS